MAKRRSKGPRPHAFGNKLILNQWLISQFGIDPLREYRENNRVLRPFHKLVDAIKDPRMEGLDESHIHFFYHNMVNQVLGLFPDAPLTQNMLLCYEENIVSHTQRINRGRKLPIVWKYYQWLTLLFSEIYLDNYFNRRTGLLDSLNEYLNRFNAHWNDFADVPAYAEDDLNKLCLQMATGSGKTLIMHVNLLQFQHYARQAGQEDALSRVILITPNERLSEQHLGEFRDSGIAADLYSQSRGSLFGAARGLQRVDILEITKLADQEGPQTIATRSLGDQNLLLVDEGHRGMSGKDEGAWFSRRNSLCEKGFTFEYSATFREAVAAAKDVDIENAYARCVFFDYSYRYFYEDGFGKDYQILNLPESYDDVKATYLTACLLKFYQQLRIYQEKYAAFAPFNIEKPLWVFVGASVTGGAWKTDEQAVASDVAQVLQFVADFLHNTEDAQSRIHRLLFERGQDTGLLDENGQDIFFGAFAFLGEKVSAGETADGLYRDMLARLFNSPAGGTLTLSRVRGDAGEIALKCGVSEEPFGLINVGDAVNLCRHCEEVCTHLEVTESEFAEPMFASVRESSSPIHLLVGAKRFVEGWDCWRVSTMGLMHVGRSEGAQIIQLFGRGVRLKGWQWSLKRSGHTYAPQRPRFVEDLEILNVFGIKSDFMQRFRDYLREEGLPGNETRRVFTVPLNVTYDFGKQLKVLRPKRKTGDGAEYDFKRDAPVPQVGDIPGYLHRNPVVSDWYPRIQAFASQKRTEEAHKDQSTLREVHLTLLDWDSLFFDLEKFKRERAWYNLNITKAGIRRVLQDAGWYRLYIPASRMTPAGFDNVALWQQIAAELLRRYCDRYYNYAKNEYIEPRLELRDLSPEDDNFPVDDQYQLIVDGSEQSTIQQIQHIAGEIKKNKDHMLSAGDLFACVFDRHLYQPLFHIRKGGKIKIAPVSLNESEYQFLKDLKSYCDTHRARFEDSGVELFLLRNMSRGKGVGFFEASNFYPDFIMWLLTKEKQYIIFIEPHGLLHEAPGSPKVLFCKKIKEVETRLQDPGIVLESFILSWTRHAQLNWGPSRKEMEKNHILFMQDDPDHYIEKMLRLSMPNPA